MSRHSVAETVRALEANPVAAEAIGSAGREIHETFLCPRCLSNWLRTTLEAYHEHLGLGLVLDDASAQAQSMFAQYVPGASRGTLCRWLLPLVTFIIPLSSGCRCPVTLAEHSDVFSS